MTKMKFDKDMFVDGVLTYHSGKVYEVADGSVDRWIKRGGIVATDKKEEATQEDDLLDAPEQDSKVVKEPKKHWNKK